MTLFVTICTLCYEEESSFLPHTWGLWMERWFWHLDHRNTCLPRDTCDRDWQVFHRTAVLPAQLAFRIQRSWVQGEFQHRGSSCHTFWIHRLRGCIILGAISTRSVQPWKRATVQFCTHSHPGDCHLLNSRSFIEIPGITHWQRATLQSFKIMFVNALCW